MTLCTYKPVTYYGSGKRLPRSMECRGYNLSMANLFGMGINRNQFRFQTL